jgi:prephenate dehydratase
MKKISIQGARGAFHEVAANAYFKDPIDLIPVAQFDDLVEDVANGKSDLGVLAIENTLAGTIHQNLKLIVNSGLIIKGEVVLRIKHYLGVYPGSKVNQLEEVRSHYMAINQCRSFFNELPKIKLVNEGNTAICAQQVMEFQDAKIGAIASKEAMEMYGLDIVASEIESNKLNYTRFLIIGRDDGPWMPESNKATFHFTLSNERGVLAKLLNQLHIVDVNLTKVESLPIEGKPWSYQFFIDMEYDNETQINMAKTVIGNNTESHILLGTYKKATHSL